MTIDEIIKYAISTPENTNPAVLRGMLKQLAVGNSGTIDGLTDEQIKQLFADRIATVQETNNMINSVLNTL